MHTQREAQPNYKIINNKRRELVTDELHSLANTHNKHAHHSTSAYYYVNSILTIAPGEGRRLKRNPSTMRRFITAFKYKIVVFRATKNTLSFSTFLKPAVAMHFLTASFASIPTVPSLAA